MGESVRVAEKKPVAKNQKSVYIVRKVSTSQSRSHAVERILFLQRTIGNRAVKRLIKSKALAKLKIGQPADEYEQEADRIAEQVMRMPEPRIQSRCPRCIEQRNKEEEKIQTKESSEHTPEFTSDIETNINSLSSGMPLPISVRTFFEPRLGYDLSQVRVHADAKAAELASAVNALAFTVGHDMVFAQSQFQPQTMDGMRLLAHELTHVVQQTGNTIRGKHALHKHENLSLMPSASPISHISYSRNALIQRRVHTISGDHAACLEQAQRWQFDCSHRGNTLCSILGARLGFSPGVGPLGGAGAYGICLDVYDRVCRSTNETDAQFCNSKNGCIEAGVSERRRPSQCGGWWDNWKRGGSGDPWPDFDDAKDTYTEWPSPPTGSSTPARPSAPGP